MGRNKPKKRMGPMERSAYVQSQGKKYGVNKEDFEKPGYWNGGRGETFNAEAYEKAVMRAANNDYDNREALKYGADSGNKHFEGLNVKGITNTGELVKLDRAMQKYGKKELGQTNSSSANDFGNISRSLFNESRDNFEDNIQDKISNDINGIRDDIELTRDWKSQAATDPLRFEHSDPVAEAQANLDKYKLNLGGRNLFSKENEPAARSNDQKDATRAFAGQYINDVKVAGNVGESADNLINAANTVKSYRPNDFHKLAL